MKKPEFELIKICKDEIFTSTTCSPVCTGECGSVCAGECQAECVNYNPQDCPKD